MAYQPIQCHIHDTLEIACMRGYTLDIELVSGETLRGIAKTTKSVNKEEFLVVETAQGSSEPRLDKIKRILVLNDNAEFKTIEINSSNSEQG